MRKKFEKSDRAPEKAVPFWERGGAGRKPKFSLKEKMRTKPSAWREETRGSGSIFLCMREKFEKSDRAPEKAVPFWERGGAGRKPKFSLKEKMRTKPSADDKL